MLPGTDSHQPEAERLGRWFFTFKTGQSAEQIHSLVFEALNSKK
jgi:hypothetical protein